ncbi:MAG: hypothetical protein WCC57_09380 [Paracoccaceae bacterium]
MKKYAYLAVSAMISLPAHAADLNTAVQDYVNATVMEWTRDPALIKAITASNMASAALTEDQIKALDDVWRAEIGKTETPSIDLVATTPTADILRAHRAESEGRIAELFIMDAKGLNVAVSDITSDYWQGDEPKFTNTFPLGAGAMFIDELELDESSQTYQVQVSIVIVDPASNQPIGAMTIGLNADRF